MAFVELQPSTSQLNGIGTGVRVSVSGRNGLRISVADEALAILGGAARRTATRSSSIAIRRSRD